MTPSIQSNVVDSTSSSFHFFQLLDLPIIFLNYMDGSTPVLSQILQSLPSQSRNAYLDQLIESIIHNSLQKTHNMDIGIFYIDNKSIFTPIFFRLQKMRFMSSMAASA
jgi:hypothetical protein